MLQTKFSNAFWEMKITLFWLKFHWHLLLGIQFTNNSALIQGMAWYPAGNQWWPVSLYICVYHKASMTWWRIEMETFSVLLALCAGNSPVTSEFPAQRPVTRSFDVFFDLCLNKRLSKQSWGWWFETSSCSLWRHSNGVNTFNSQNTL